MADTYSDRLRSLRRFRGLTQDELARKAGLKPITVSRSERGAATASVETSTALADALDVTLDLLLLGRGEWPEGFAAFREADVEPLPTRRGHACATTSPGHG